MEMAREFVEPFLPTPPDLRAWGSVTQSLVRRNIISPAEARSKAKIPENFPG